MSKKISNRCEDIIQLAEHLKVFDYASDLFTAESLTDEERELLESDYEVIARLVNNLDKEVEELKKLCKTF